MIFSFRLDALPQGRALEKKSLRAFIGENMSEEAKIKILSAWNRHIGENQRRYRKNEGSAVQFEDTKRLFKQGVLSHPSLSKAEKDELLAHMGFKLA